MTGDGFRRPTRRSVLKTTAALGVGGSILQTTGTAQTGGDEYVLEQGSTCVPLTPLSGSESVESFYEWDVLDTLYSSFGTTDLQQGDTTIMFLYRDPDDRLYLVIVHDEYGQDSPNGGGSVTFRFPGLPEGGDWVVRDDQYDAPSSTDNWLVDREPEQIDWTWTNGRTDGAVFGPLPSTFDFGIEPLFNEAATLFDIYYEGRITDWQVLSGDRSSPNRTSLNMNSPVRFHTGGCDGGGTSPGPARIDLRVPTDAPDVADRGLIPVDIFASNAIALDEIDPKSITASPGHARPRHIEYLGERGIRLYLPTRELEIASGATEVITVVAETTSGRRAVGKTAVTAPSRSGGTDHEEPDTEHADRTAEDETAETEADERDTKGGEQSGDDREDEDAEREQAERQEEYEQEQAERQEEYEQEQARRQEEYEQEQED